jgi:hypothetical protein
LTGLLVLNTAAENPYASLSPGADMMRSVPPTPPRDVILACEETHLGTLEREVVVPTAQSASGLKETDNTIAPRREKRQIDTSIRDLPEVARGQHRTRRRPLADTERAHGGQAREETRRRHTREGRIRGND